MPPRAQAVDVVFELAPRAQERVAERDVGIRVGGVRVGRVPDHEVVTWNTELDSTLVEPSFVMMPVRRFDDDVTAHDAVENLFEVVDRAPDPRFERRTRLQLVERDAKRSLHAQTNCDVRANRRSIGERRRKWRGLVVVTANPARPALGGAGRAWSSRPYARPTEWPGPCICWARRIQNEDRRDDEDRHSDLQTDR